MCATPEPVRSVDRGIESAVTRLNLLTGVSTKASCQGRTPAEHSTHAELAYVLLHEPMPLALEDRLLAALGDVARIEPDGLYCRWPKRNAEFCARLADVASSPCDFDAKHGWHQVTVSVAALDRLIARRISGDCRHALVWCRRCDTLGDPAKHRDCVGFAVVVPYVAERTRSAFDRFVDRHPSPLDPRLRAREGAERLLQRLRRGDFGAAYRADWRRSLAIEAANLRRGELRSAVRTLRSPGIETDVFVTRAAVVFAHRLDPRGVGA